MRTALQLLFLLALASVPGSFLPQRQLNPIRVNEYVARHRTLGPLLDRAQAFDVYSSTWFSAVYLLLFVSLVGCLLPRTLVHLGALRRRPPPTPRHLARLRLYERWPATGDDLDRASRALRGWRKDRVGTSVAAERGLLQETGNLLFHMSLVVLLVGVAIGSFRGFKGTVLVVEGRGFSNTLLSYDNLQLGRRFDPGSLSPFSVRLQDFRATYTQVGAARTFDAVVDGPNGKQDIRVNHPLVAGAAKVYLIGHGYAPRLRVRDSGGVVVFDQAVPCLPQDVRFLSTCVIKVPDAKPQQLSFRGVLTPTTVLAEGRVGSSYPALRRPFLTLVGFQGDLGLDSGVAQSVYTLRTGGLTPLEGGAARALRPSDSWALPGGGSLTYVGTDEWATFQVTQDPGKVVVLVASVGILIGLSLSLSVRRRRVWLRVVEGADGSYVELGGLARSHPERFEQDFRALAIRLRES